MPSTARPASATTRVRQAAILVSVPYPATQPVPAGWRRTPNAPEQIHRRFKGPLAASEGLLRLRRQMHEQSEPGTRHASLRELERTGGWKLMLFGHLGLLHEGALGVDATTLSLYPRVRAGRILAMCKDDRLPQARREWAAFVRSQTQASRPLRIPHWEMELLAEIVSGYAGDAPTRARLDDLQRLIHEIPEREAAARGAGFNILLNAAIERGEFVQALPFAERALVEFRRAGSMFGELFVYVQRGLAHGRSGHLQAAADDFEAARVLGGRHFETDSVLVALPTALAGVVAYERGDLAAAALALDRALPVIEQEEGWTEPLWLIFRCANALALQRGIPQAALALLARAQQVARRRGLVRLGALLSLQELDFALRLQRHERAAGLAGRRLAALAARDHYAMPAWREAVLHARLIQATHERPAPAATRLLELVRDCRQSNMPHLVCRALLLQAAASATQGDHAAVRTALEELLDRLDVRQVWRSLIDAPGMAAAWASLPRPVLRSLSANHRATARTFAAALRDEQRHVLSGVDVVAISVHEQQILQALGQRLRNKEIARKLGRSENTVKFHLKQLARKFGVSGRRAIYEQALALGIVE